MNSRTRFNATSHRILVLSILAFAIVVVTLTILRPFPLKDRSEVIETIHLAELLPHIHADGDSPEDMGHHVDLESAIFVTTRDMYVASGKLEMVNAPEVVVHHIALINRGSADSHCSLVSGNRLFGAGSDAIHKSSGGFPKETALFIPKGTCLQLTAMIHNPDPPVGPGGTYHDVYARITLFFSQQSPRDLHLLSYKELYVTDTCAHTPPLPEDFSSFSVPSLHTDYHFSGCDPKLGISSYIFDRPATIYYLGGHLHGWQGGKELIVMKNDKEMYRFTTRVSSTTPYLYETIHFATSTPVNAGDRITLSAIYDNPSRVPLRGAMGGIGMYFSYNETRTSPE